MIDTMMFVAIWIFGPIVVLAIAFGASELKRYKSSKKKRPNPERPKLHF